MLGGEGPVSILVYDDDVSCAEVLAATLRNCGYIVHTANHFGPALKVLEAGCIDLLIADLVIPGGVNGVALARMGRLRHRSMKTVYMSGYDLGDVEAEADGPPILRKPIPEERLLDAVRDALTT
jgi:DNA-binding NtrC family response regulator